MIGLLFSQLIMLLFEECSSSVQFRDFPAPRVRHIARYTLEGSTIEEMNPWTDTRRYPLDRDFDYMSICSDLHYLGIHEDTQTYHFLGISDGGPEESCKSKGEGDVWKPLPQYGASIARFSLDETSISDTFVEGSIVVDKWIPLQFRPTSEILSFSPTLQYYLDEDCEDGFDMDDILPPGGKYNDGMDCEGISRLSSGLLLVAEEYGPSLAVVDESGVVQIRYFCEGHSADFVTSYPKKEIFPEIVASARARRGFESIAVSHDETTAWMMLQSAIASAKNDIVRVFKLDISDPYDISVTATYLYRQTDILLWRIIVSDVSEREIHEEDINIGAMEWINENKLIISEREDGGYILYLVNFEDATNILEWPEANDEEDPIELEDLDDLGVTLPSKIQLMTPHDVRIDKKIEGITAIGQSLLAVCYDSDFAEPTELDIIHLDVLLPLHSAQTQENCRETCKPYLLTEPFLIPRIMLGDPESSSSSDSDTSDSDTSDSDTSDSDTSSTTSTSPMKFRDFASTPQRSPSTSPTTST